MTAESSPPRRRRGRPPKSDGDDTRRRILEAALDLFAQKGYEATTVREIAEAVGFRDSAIYSHFESKRQVYDALLQEAGSRLPSILGLTSSALAERDPEAALSDFVNRIVSAWDEWDNRRFTSVLLREHLKDMDTALGEVRQILEKVFANWIENGSIRPDIAPEVLAWEFTGTLIAVRLLYITSESTEEERLQGLDVAKAHLNYFLKVLTEHHSGEDPGLPQPPWED